MDFYRRCRNVAHTCRHFGISGQTFYWWQRRYDPCDLTTLEVSFAKIQNVHEMRVCPSEETKMV